MSATSSDSKSFPRVILSIIIGLIILAAGWFGYQQATAAKPAPDATFTLLNRDVVKLSSLRGKVVMVNFWATSCSTCVAEMPRMVETYQRYQDKGLEFIAVAMSYDPPMYVSNFAETRKLPFKVALDTAGDAARLFDKVEMTPTTFVINKQGQIIKRYLGEPNFDELSKLLDSTLAEAS